MTTTYNTYLDGVQKATGLTEKTYTFEGLYPETEYTLGVTAVEDSSESRKATKKVTTGNWNSLSVEQWQEILSRNTPHGFTRFGTYENKVTGSYTENNMEGYFGHGDTLVDWINYAEFTQDQYNKVMELDGVAASYNVPDTEGHKYAYAYLTVNAPQELKFWMGENFYTAIGANTNEKKYEATRKFIDKWTSRVYVTGKVNSQVAPVKLYTVDYSNGEAYTEVTDLKTENGKQFFEYKATSQILTATNSAIDFVAAVGDGETVATFDLEIDYVEHKLEFKLPLDLTFYPA